MPKLGSKGIVSCTQAEIHRGKQASGEGWECRAQELVWGRSGSWEAWSIARCSNDHV